jgi:hypothetical protein
LTCRFGEIESAAEIGDGLRALCELGAGEPKVAAKGRDERG